MVREVIVKYSALFHTILHFFTLVHTRTTLTHYVYYYSAAGPHSISHLYPVYALLSVSKGVSGLCIRIYYYNYYKSYYYYCSIRCLYTYMCCVCLYTYMCYLYYLLAITAAGPVVCFEFLELIAIYVYADYQ